MAKTAADYQNDATNRYNELVSQYGGADKLPANIWTTDPKLVAAHEGVVAAKARSNETYNSSTGTWSAGDSGDKVVKTSGKTRGDYQADAEDDAADAIRSSLGGSTYETMSDDEIRQYAENLSNMKYDAAIQALRGQGDTLKSDYDSALSELDAMYGNRQAIAEAAIDKAGKQARDEAIARGGQRGGLETYIENNLDKQIMSDLANTENQIMAKKNTLRSSFDTSMKNNLAVIQQAIADKGSYAASTVFDTKANQADKAAYYDLANNQLMAPYLMETVSQKRANDNEETALNGYNATGKDYGSVTSNSKIDAAIKALQNRAGDIYNGLSAAEKANPNVWTQNSALADLHNQVAQLQGNNKTYDSVTGKWTTLDNMLNSYGVV